jgi:signal transduction histidine kinase
MIQQDREFRRTLEAAAPNGVEFYTDPVDGVRFQGDELMPEFLALLTKKYRRNEVDIVVAVADFGLDFAERYQAQLWPNKPVLILGIEEQRLRQRGLPSNFAYLPLHIDVEGTLALAEALQPKAERLVVIAGEGAFEKQWAERSAQAARSRANRRWAPEIWSGVPLRELRERLAALDPRTAVLYTFMYRDREGHKYFPLDVVKPMAEVSGAPIYSWYPNYFDRGLTAGSLSSHEDHGRRAGELAISILRGEIAASGATLPATASRCMANVERIEAFGLDVNALPAGCELAYQSPSLWRDHRGKLLAGLALFILQAMTIAGLLVQRHRLRLAGDDAARRRAELSRAARAATVGELSASIAHEVGQPLGAIVTNTQTAELLLEGGITDAVELQQILADVRRDALRAHEVVRRLRALLEKHAVEFAQVDLSATFGDALAVLAPEARRRGMTIECSFIEGSAPLRGDPIQLQQVLLNLVLNAMDAMQDTAAGGRVVSVSLSAVDSNFELTVADRGHGLLAGHSTRLFESFFTTKPHGLGLGLSIVRTVVVAHGGRVWATPRDGGGSVFTVRLPRMAVAPAKRTEDSAASVMAERTQRPAPAVSGEHP